MRSLLRGLDAEAAAVEAVHAEMEEGRPPWCTLGEQFAILEDELRARIMKISRCDDFFSREQAASRRCGAILPHCMPMARATLAEDQELAALRFRLVPRKLSEEEFWRSPAMPSRRRTAAQGASRSATAGATSRGSRRSRLSSATISPAATTRAASLPTPLPASTLATPTSVRARH